MPEVNALRASENSYSPNNHRSKTIIIQSNRKPEMYHLRSNEPKRTPTYDLLKPVSSPSQNNSRPGTVTIKRKSPALVQPVHRQKAEMYHIEMPGKRNLQSPSAVSLHQKPMSNGVLTQSNTHYPQKVTTYMIKTSNEGHFLPPIARTPSPRVSRISCKEKKNN